MQTSVRWLMYVFLALLTGCSFFTKDEPYHLTEASLAELENTPIHVRRSTLPSTTLLHARQSYLSVLQRSGQAVVRHEAMLRLAEIETRLAENALANGQDALMQQHLVLAVGYYQKLLRQPGAIAQRDRLRYQLARVLALQGDVPHSLALLQTLSREKSDRAEAVEARFRLAESAFSAKKYVVSRALYEQVLGQGDRSSLYKTALYKHAWSEFKLQNYTAAFADYMQLLDRVYTPDMGPNDVAHGLLQDTLRVAAMTLSYMQGPLSARKYFAAHGHRPFEAQVYQSLADLYAEQRRFQDTATTYLVYVAANPLQDNAPQMENRAIGILAKAGFVDLVLLAKQRFVQHYQKTSVYWRGGERPRSAEVAAWLKIHLGDVMAFYHARAQQKKNVAAYRLAALWYRMYLANFPKDPDTLGKRWLLAELLHDAGDVGASASEYQRLAYASPTFSPGRREEAGYRVVLARQSQLEVAMKLPCSTVGTKVKMMRTALIKSAQRYTTSFPQAVRVAGVMAQITELYVAAAALEKAVVSAQKILHLAQAGAKYRRRAREVIADAEFDLHRYARAERAITAVLRLDAPSASKAVIFHQRRAQAIYKQAELARSQGKMTLAVKHFLRVGRVEPGSKVRENAEFDAATLLLQTKKWSRAVNILSAFRSHFPRSKLVREVPAKLVLAYEAMANYRGAAREYEVIAVQTKHSRLARTAIWAAAQSWMKVGGKPAQRKAVRLWKQYIKDYPKPAAVALEARKNLVLLYAQLGVKWKQDFWRRRIIAAVAAGRLKDERARLLAAEAQMSLANDALVEFKSIPLRQPLSRSLRKKKYALKRVLKDFGRVLDYKIAPMATEAGYQVGEIYAVFAESLLKSERPTGLSALAREEYDTLLEERVYPFEEQAIDALEANLRLTRQGIWDQWMEKTLSRLRKLMPARYDKSEVIDDFAV